MPGSIHAELARGCHKLIRQGAKLVETPVDVLEEFTDLGAVAPLAAGSASAPAQADLFGTALAYVPVTFDVLCERSGVAPNVAETTLKELELGGTVERMPGNRNRRLA